MFTKQFDPSALIWTKHVSFQNQFEFLDFTNLDANDRDELTAILKPNAVTEGLKLPWDRGENDYHEFSEQNQVQQEPKVWQPYGKICLYSHQCRRK